ncbi:MAG: RcnB family protein [Burkholderiaceae bacterium]|nr:RcnB family protein [Burkholderiaceae bacterium]
MEKIMTIQKISAIVSATLLAGGLLAGATAQAQPAPDREDHHHSAVRPDHHRPPPPPAVRRAGPSRYGVGNTLPYGYRGHNYRIDDWGRYRLPRPHRGQYWVQYGGQFLLLTPAGVVVQVFVP